ncbi:MAG: hypothetical protein RLZZ449_583, partial [Actinomycetota bacterium]
DRKKSEGKRVQCRNQNRHTGQPVTEQQHDDNRANHRRQIPRCAQTLDGEIADQQVADESTTKSHQHAKRRQSDDVPVPVIVTTGAQRTNDRIHANRGEREPKWRTRGEVRKEVNVRPIF